MKCRKCGNSFRNGMVCPLCGHKNIGKIDCSVCGKRIHYGQGHCSSCGTPTQYCKKVEAVARGNSIDYTIHSEESHTYEPKEQYDYKKDAYQYNQKESTKGKDYISSWFNTVKEKQEQMHTKVFNNTAPFSKQSGSMGNIVAGVVVVVLVIGFCVSALLPSEENTQPVVSMNYGNTDVENLPITGTNNNLIEQANFANGQWASLYGDKVYITSGYIYEMDKDFRQPATVNETVRNYVYRDDVQMYYVDDWDTLVYQDIRTKEDVIVSEGVEVVLYLDGSLYYQKYEDNKTIYQYNILRQETFVVTNQYHSCLRVDTTTNKLYYLDMGLQLVAVSNLNEGQKTYDTYDLPITNFLVEGNNVYTYKDAQGFSLYDLSTKAQISNTIHYEVKQYARITNGYLCLLDNGSLYKMLDDGTSTPIIENDTKYLQFQVVGDKILLKDEDNGEIIVYLANEMGDIARIHF